MRRYVTLSAMACLALSGCGGSAPDAIHADNDVRRYDVSPLLRPLRTDTPITPVRPGGRAARPHKWETADVFPDGRTLLVRYFDDCGWLHGADVAETRTSVTVTVVVAAPTGADGDVCLGPAVTRTARVDLARPLGGRVVLDGYDRRPRRVLQVAD